MAAMTSVANQESERSLRTFQVQCNIIGFAMTTDREPRDKT